MFTGIECGSSDLPVIPSIINVYSESEHVPYIC
jgi:hypothetical protein